MTARKTKPSSKDPKSARSASLPRAPRSARRPDEIERPDDAAALSELEEDSLPEPDFEAHPSPPHRAPGQRPSEEGSGFGVVDSGLSVDPEELGRQFLSDATEQDNFESSADVESSNRTAAPLDPVLSEATLASSGQRAVLPASGALSGSDEVTSEPATEDLDMLSNTELPTSLFDHPARPEGEDLGEGEDQERAEAEVEAGTTHAPVVNADEVAVFEQKEGSAEVDPDAREQAMEEERAALRRTRDRSEVKTDRGAWESNRRAGRAKPLHRGPGR